MTNEKKQNEAIMKIWKKDGVIYHEYNTIDGLNCETLEGKKVIDRASFICSLISKLGFGLKEMTFDVSMEYDGDIEMIFDRLEWAMFAYKGETPEDFKKRVTENSICDL